MKLRYGLNNTEEYTQNLLYNWPQSLPDAPSDNMQLVRNLKAELMWECFDEYRSKEWFVSLLALLDNIE